MKVNKVYNENCLDTMKRMPDNYVDLTVTSPPYDKMRTYHSTYKGYDFPRVAIELFRVTKIGGIVVWIINDYKRNGSKSLTSFKQAILFNEVGFNIHDVMIWNKVNHMPQVIKNYYPTAFDYMFVLSKGIPKTTNLIQVPCKHAGKKIHTYKNKDSVYYRPHDNTIRPIKPTKTKSNVWDIFVGGRTNYGHPAIFPEQLAHDHILSWSNVGDLVYDPFLGSGTTAKVAKQLKRDFIGSDTIAKYCKIAIERINGGK